jgi:hypothetical protein
MTTNAPSAVIPNRRCGVPCLLCEREVDRDYCADCFEGIRKQAETRQEILTARFRRCVEVENILLRAAHEGRSIPADESRTLALRLGIPDEVREDPNKGP